MGCDDRPTGPDFVDFDYGVNSGTGRVTKLRAVLDPKTLAPADYVKQACAARSSFLHSLKTWSVFGKGWGNREASWHAQPWPAEDQPIPLAMEAALPASQSLPLT